MTIDEQLKEYELAIVGRWLCDKRKSIFDFNLVPRSLQPGVLTVTNLENSKSIKTEYSISKSLTHDWIISFRFIGKEKDYKIKYLTDTMLITQFAEDYSVEEIFVRIPDDSN